MEFIFNPWRELNVVDDEVRLVIHNLEKQEFFKIVILDKKEGEFILDEPITSEELGQLRYRYQIKKENWVDVARYKMLLDKNNLQDYIFKFDKVTDRDREQLVFSLRKRLASSSSVDFTKTTYEFMRKLWMNAKIPYNRVSDLTDYVKTHFGFEPTLFGNIMFYMDMYVKLKEEFEKVNCNRKYFDSSFKEMHKNPMLISMIQKKIEECEPYLSSLQMANVISGKLESFLGNRRSATKLFKKAQGFENNFIQGLDYGVYTYQDSMETSPFEASIKFLDDHEKEKKPSLVILISVDVNFLKFYGARLLYYVSVLKDYHFHFHVIGEISEVEEKINETKSLMKSINDFRGAVLGTVPTFSMESVPENVGDLPTYYACSRYVNALSVMDHFESDVFIMDADMAFLADPDQFFNSLKKYDVAVPFAMGITTLCPWRRIMAGNVFLKNNRKGRMFSALVKDYIVSNIDKTTSWTLDQNALTYAYEQLALEQVSFGNVNLFSRPIQQGTISNKIEKL